MVGAHIPPDFADGFDIARVDEVVDQPNVFAPVSHQGGQPGRGQSLHYFRTPRVQARDAALPKWAVARQREQDGQIAQNAVADHNGFVAAVDAHMDMEAKCHQLSGRVLKQIDEAHVSFVGRDFLFAPCGKRVRARPVEARIFSRRCFGQHPKFFLEIRFDLGKAFADFGVDFDVALHQFGLDFVRVFFGDAIENRGIFAAQGHGFCIDQSQFYFHANRGLGTGIKFESRHGNLHFCSAMERNS